MEITEMKDVIKGILEGEFDEELKSASKDQENEENFGLEISVNRNLAKQIDEIMKKRGCSFETFVELCKNVLISGYIRSLYL